MRACSEQDAAGNFAFDAEQLHDHRSEHRAQKAGQKKVDPDHIKGLSDEMKACSMTILNLKFVLQPGRHTSQIGSRDP